MPISVDQYLGRTPAATDDPTDATATPYKTPTAPKAPTTQPAAALPLGAPTGELTPATQQAAPAGTPDPLAFAQPPAAMPLANVNLSPVSPPTMPGGANDAAISSAPAGYGGTGTYGGMSYADAVQAKYKADQAAQAASGVEMAPQDYSMAGLTDSGAWGMSAADLAANAARTASVENDPTSTAGAKSLAALPGYATANFDRSLNNGSNPDLANQVQQLLGESAAEHVATPAPTGEDYLVNGVHYSNFADAQKAEQDPAAAGAGGAGGSGGTRSLTPGAANDAGHPSSGVGAPIGTATGGPSAPGGTAAAPGTSTSGGLGVKLTPTDPNNALTNQTITPDNSVDRVKLAQDALSSTIQNILDPQYQADLRDTSRYNFGAGRGVSGMNRTNLGNVQSDYERTKAQLSNNLMTAATTGSIDDMYKNLGIAQQQQGFQAGQQQNAFGNAVTQAQLEDALTNSAFGRALSQEQAGYSGNPSDIDLILSQIFGNQSSAAGNAAAGLFSNAGKGSASSTSNSELLKYLLQLNGGGTGGGGDVPSAMGQ